MKAERRWARSLHALDGRNSTRQAISTHLESNAMDATGFVQIVDVNGGQYMP